MGGSTDLAWIMKSDNYRGEWSQAPETPGALGPILCVYWGMQKGSFLRNVGK